MGLMKQFDRRLVCGMLLVASVLCTTSCKDEQEMYSFQGEKKETKPATTETKKPNAQTGGTQVFNEPSVDKKVLPPKEKKVAGIEVSPVPTDRKRLTDESQLGVLAIAGVDLSLPSTFSPVPPERLSKMRAFQADIPPAEGETRAGEFVIFVFGPGQGGGVGPNITRWLGQMELDETFKPIIYQSDVKPFEVTELYAKGTLKPSSMGTGPTESQPGSAMYAIIVEGGPNGALYIKAIGSAKTIEATMPALATMVDKLKLTQ